MGLIASSYILAKSLQSKCKLILLNYGAVKNSFLNMLIYYAVGLIVWLRKFFRIKVHVSLSFGVVMKFSDFDVHLKKGMKGIIISVFSSPVEAYEVEFVDQKNGCYDRNCHFGF